MNEEIIKAFDAKLEHESEGLTAWEQLVALEYFIEGVDEGLKQERERCAKICEDMRTLCGRAWTEEQALCYEVLSKAAENIRKG